jgi:hypothetical protein
MMNKWVGSQQMPKLSVTTATIVVTFFLRLSEFEPCFFVETFFGTAIGTAVDDGIADLGPTSGVLATGRFSKSPFDSDTLGNSMFSPSLIDRFLLVTVLFFLMLCLKRAYKIIQNSFNYTSQALKKVIFEKSLPVCADLPIDVRASGRKRAQ